MDDVNFTHNHNVIHFIKSAELGDLNHVQSILPLMLWCNVNFGMQRAIRSGQLNIVQFLLPHLKSGQDDWILPCLFTASEHKQQNILDFLYSLCEIGEVKRCLHLYKNSYPDIVYKEGEFDMLEQRIKIDEEKAILLSQVAGTDNIQRQKKM